MARVLEPIVIPQIGDTVRVSFPVDKSGPPMVTYVVVDQDACHFYVVPTYDLGRMPVRVPLRNAYL